MISYQSEQDPFYSRSFLALASMLALAGARRAVTLLVNFDSIDFIQDLGSASKQKKKSVHVDKNMTTVSAE